MDPSTQRALGAVNQRFYVATALAFDATRSHAWPGWERVVEHAAEHAAEGAAAPDRPRRVLDIGCGNGRFERFLAERGEAFDYLGIDGCEALLETARRRATGPVAARFAQVDFLDPGPEAALPRGPFDLVALFGVLHHVPGRAARGALLRAAASRLAPGGLLAATFWQFGASERFRDRALPWSRAPEVDPAALEPGDHLLPWGTGEGPPRYCHFSDAAEIDGLVAGLERVSLVDRFEADGRSGDLNTYVVLRGEA